MKAASDSIDSSDATTTSLGVLALLPKFTSPAKLKDFEKFKDRIATFFDKFGSMPSWVAKPLSLSPPDCARYGWTCSTVDMLICSVCKAHLCCKISDPFNVASYNECVNGIVKSLKEEHRKSCPWKDAPCPEAYCLMQPVLKKDAFKSFEFRLESLIGIADALPNVTETPLLDRLSEDVLKEIYKICHLEDTKNIKPAVFLAVTGWSRSLSTGKMKFIWCDFCLRKVGTWFYKSTETSLQESEDIPSEDSKVEDDDSSPKKKMKLEEKFDPLYEHRSWCIWVRNTDSEKPGWEVFTESFLKNFEESKETRCDQSTLNDSFDQLSRIREIFSNWNTSPISTSKT